jgi:hypothetical protein
MSRLDRQELRQRLEFSERKRTFLQKTLKKRTVEEDTFLWSMADLMTLLLIFFILLYSQTGSITAADREALFLERFDRGEREVFASSSQSPTTGVCQ